MRGEGKTWLEKVGSFERKVRVVYNREDHENFDGRTRNLFGVHFT